MKTRITAEEINRVYRESLKCPNCGSYELADTGMHACSGTAERPDFFEVEVDPIEEEVCESCGERTWTLRDGSLPFTHRNGYCQPPQKIEELPRIKPSEAKKWYGEESWSALSSVVVKINELIREHNKLIK